MAKPILRLAELDDFSPEVLQYLSDHFVVDTTAVSRDDLAQVMQECDAFWFRLGYKIDDKVLSCEQRCRVLATPTTGIDHIDEVLCKNYNIEIACLRGEKEFLRKVRATAEHTILLVLALMRNLTQSVADVLAGNWNRDNFRGYELYEKTVGIVGYGRLGKIVAEYFLAMGCKVYAVDTAKMYFPKNINRCLSLQDLIIKADIISLHIPYNEANHHLLSEEIFKLFTGDKYLINTSRGGIIDEQALLTTLNNKKIGGAALDVLAGEPDVAHNPLLAYARKHHNLVITPHLGGNTFESFAKTERFIAEKVIALFKAR